jgi:UDP-N-acetylglucosamine acyltransferase
METGRPDPVRLPESAGAVSDGWPAPDQDHDLPMEIPMTFIHPTAIVDKEAELDNDVEIGAYSVVRGKVRLGGGTVVMNHVTLFGDLTLGRENKVHPGAVLGNAPQDTSYRGEPTSVVIGDRNLIRECVTINRGTAKAHGITTIGHENLIMAYTHIAHDCTIGDRNIMPNATNLSGHVIIGNDTHTGGLNGIHQFVTIGDHAFIGFSSRITKDVPPYIIVEGNPARERTLNRVGLERAGFSKEELFLLKEAFKILYVSKHPFTEKAAILLAPPYDKSPHVRKLRAFVVATANGKNGRSQLGG